MVFIFCTAHIPATHERDLEPSMPCKARRLDHADIRVQFNGYVDPQKGLPLFDWCLSYIHNTDEFLYNHDLLLKEQSSFVRCRCSSTARCRQGTLHPNPRAVPVQQHIDFRLSRGIILNNLQFKVRVLSGSVRAFLQVLKLNHPDLLIVLSPLTKICIMDFSSITSTLPIAR